MLGEVTLFHHATLGVAAYAIDPGVTNGCFHLLYNHTAGVALSDEPGLLEAYLVRSTGSLALTGHYHVDTLPQPRHLLEAEALNFLRSTGASYNRYRRRQARRPPQGC